MSLGIACYLGSAVRHTGQEIRQVIEIQGAPEIVVDYLVDGGTPEFVTKFQVVLSHLPRIVVNEMPVGVHAIARDRAGRADLRKVANADRRKTVIIGAHSRI